MTTIVSLVKSIQENASGYRTVGLLAESLVRAVSELEIDSSVYVGTSHHSAGQHVGHSFVCSRRDLDFVIEWVSSYDELDYAWTEDATGLLISFVK